MASKSSKKSERSYKLDGNCFTDSRILRDQYKESKYTRFTSLFIRTYSDVSEVKAILQCVEPTSWAYILHDRDIKEDGTPKEPHIHLLLYVKEQVSLIPFIKGFGQNTLIQVCKNRPLAFQYLVHKNDPDKTQYSPSEVVEYQSEPFSAVGASPFELKEQRNEMLFRDLETLTPRELAYKYGRDYMLHADKYHAFVRNVRYDEECGAERKKLKGYLELPFVREVTDPTLGEITFATYMATQLANLLSQVDAYPSEYEVLRMLNRVMDNWHTRIAFANESDATGDELKAFLEGVVS